MFLTVFCNCLLSKVMQHQQMGQPSSLQQQQQSMQQPQSNLPPTLPLQGVQQLSNNQMIVNTHQQQYDAQQQMQLQHMTGQQLPPQQITPQQLSQSMPPQQPPQQLGGSGGPGTPDGGGQAPDGGLTHDQLKQMLQNQLEYYFSR